MRLFRSIVASAAVVIATAYVPPHMELPSSWTNVALGTVRSRARSRQRRNVAPAVFVVVRINYWWLPYSLVSCLLRTARYSWIQIQGGISVWRRGFITSVGNGLHVRGGCNQQALWQEWMHCLRRSTTRWDRLHLHYLNVFARSIWQ
jgi:hypothetical protein